jgi:hypothetical protein
MHAINFAVDFTYHRQHFHCRTQIIGIALNVFIIIVNDVEKGNEYSSIALGHF